MVEKYGVEHIMQLPEFVEKSKQTQIDKYGSYYQQTEEYKQKVIKTNLERYGVMYAIQLQSVQDKRMQTNIERYGVEHVSQSEIFKKKIEETSLEKYGVKNHLQNEDIKNKISATNMRRYGVTRYTKLKSFRNSVSGENNFNWKGGINSENDKIRHSIEYKEWRKLVYQRDNFTCQCCGDNTGGNLQAHHIYNFSDHIELRFNVDFGITLCDKCHAINKIDSYHHKYGSKNNNYEQLKEYIEQKTGGEWNWPYINQISALHLISPLILLK